MTLGQPTQLNVRPSLPFWFFFLPSPLAGCSLQSETLRSAGAWLRAQPPCVVYYL